MNAASTPYKRGASGQRVGITSHEGAPEAQQHQGRRAGRAPREALGPFTPTLGTPGRLHTPKISRARTGGAFILGDMFRFADSLALAAAGALSAALASGQPGEQPQPGQPGLHSQPGQPGGARG